MGSLESFDSRLNTVCTILAIYNLAAAFEFARADGEQLLSRHPAVVLLIVVALGYLSWVLLNFAMPIRAAQSGLGSFWFPATVLLTLLLRVALAFTVLSMAKERREFEQRVDALTDPLTGLANRRALFEAADAASQERDGGGEALSVLIFGQTLGAKSSRDARTRRCKPSGRGGSGAALRHTGSAARLC